MHVHLHLQPKEKTGICNVTFSITTPKRLPQKSACPNHSTPPTKAMIFADFALDNAPDDCEDEDPAAVWEDEAIPDEVEDTTAPGEVEVEDFPEDAEDECPTDAEDEVAPAASSVLQKSQSATQQMNDQKRGNLRINDIVEQQQRRRRSPRRHHKRMLTIRQARLAEHGVVVRVRARRVRCEIECPNEGIVERKV